MTRSLLLIFLISWSHVVPLSYQCNTGIAHPGFVLDILRSLMANADVAVIQTYQADDVNVCMKECCTEKYGSCTVVSFKQNVSEKNCQHFNCRPVVKCKYLSSKTIDSFSFSSSPMPQSAVPLNHTSKNHSLVLTTTESTKSQILNGSVEHKLLKNVLAAYRAEQLALKNDNTTIKPRKGVDNYEGLVPKNITRSGVKPRKGVSLNNISVSSDAKSKVKPRKGVGPYEASTSSPLEKELFTHSISSAWEAKNFSLSPSIKTYKETMASDLISALEKVLEDDPSVKELNASSIEHTSLKDTIISSTSPIVPSAVKASVVTITESSSYATTSSSELRSSLATSYAISTSAQTPHLQTLLPDSTELVSYTPISPITSPTIFEHSKLLFHEVTTEDTTENSEESEKERRYKSSMHLVLSLVFGLLVLFAVMGVVAKRVYDSWMRRHYRRMDFLIDGMYNGYG